MDDIHEDLVKQAREESEDIKKKLDELFAEHYKIGVDVSSEISEEDGHPGDMLEQILGIEHD